MLRGAAAALLLASLASASEPRIAFVERDERSGRRELIVADAKATPLRRVHDSKDVYDPSWSPDGSRLLYTVGLSTPVVWTAFASGGPGRPVRGTEGSFRPRYSWDGESIVFTRDGAVWAVAGEGGKARMVCAAPGRKSFRETAPAPDGTRMAAVMDREVVVMDRDCAHRKPLTSDGATKTLAGWSQAGLAYLDARGVVVLPASGASSKGKRCPGLFLHATWTDDGRLLAEALVDAVDKPAYTRLSLLDPRDCSATTLSEYKESSLNGAAWRRTSRK